MLQFVLYCIVLNTEQIDDVSVNSPLYEMMGSEYLSNIILCFLLLKDQKGSRKLKPQVHHLHWHFTWISTKYLKWRTEALVPESYAQYSIQHMTNTLHHQHLSKWISLQFVHRCCGCQRPRENVVISKVCSNSGLLNLVAPVDSLRCPQGMFLN